MLALELKDVNYSYFTKEKETKALQDINLSVKKGQFISIVGPSGCGKSTLLSIICGLIEPTSGEVIVNGRPVKDEMRNIGYMLQHDHLFEWRSIRRNVLLGPEINHILSSEHQTLADRLLKDYGLDKFQYKRPCELSGGMKQRAALIRTMLMHPKLLLLDEPFSALDYQTRLMVSADIGRIIKSSKITAILITHDLSEAISLADRIIVLSKRPARIKKDLPIHLTLKDQTPLAARNAPEFSSYFSILWKEIADEYQKTN